MCDGCSGIEVVCASRVLTRAGVPGRAVILGRVLVDTLVIMLVSRLVSVELTRQVRRTSGS